MVGNRYGYVSFSKPQINPELSRLIEAARHWVPIKGRVLDHFDFAAWRERMQAGAAFDPIPSVDQTDPEAVAAAIFDILLLDRYRNGPKENALPQRQHFLKRIAQRVLKHEPVELIIPSFPGRPVNPLTHARTQPDLGEVASFTRFWQISEHVRTVYEPGLRFIISLDGQAYAPFYGYSREIFRPYQKDLHYLIDQLGLGHLVQLVDLQSLVDERKEEFTELHAQAVEELKQEWSKPEYSFRDELVSSMKLGVNTAAIHVAAIKLVKYYQDEVDVVASIREMREAVHEQAYHTAFAYMCFLVTIRRMDLLERKFPEAIRGTVHPKEGQYSPYLVNSATKIVPWHGVAVLRPDGRVDSVYESEIFEEPGRYTGVFLSGEYTPFYYEEVQ